MKRILALLLILLLPFQTTLASVMAIEMSAPAAPMQMLAGEECHHQMTDSANVTDLAATSDEMSADGSANPHGNCGICHFSCCSALPIGAALAPVFSTSENVAVTPTTQPSAPPTERPERPNWASLA